MHKKLKVGLIIDSYKINKDVANLFPTSAGGGGFSGKLMGYSIRLFRSSPVGADRRTITATSTANISSTALQVTIPFGYMVEAIRITNLQPATNLTSVSATHNNTAGASLGTLITGKTVNAATSQIFPCTLLDMPSQVTDGTVRLIATGNGANGLRIDVILRKTMTI
jgi:hypothetical protein